MADIVSQSNEIFIRGEFTTRDLPRLVAAMHNLTDKFKYPDLVLDFSDCTRAYAGGMLAVVARSQSYQMEGVDIALKVPKDPKLQGLFYNSNWASLIDFRHFEESNYRGYKQVPVIKFSNGAEQHKAVDRILGIVLSALKGFSRNELQAIEWCLNELTDNVINHSESKTGGLVQVTNFGGSNQKIELAICDAGVGIPKTLRATHPEIATDHESLDSAIREGVTRDKSIGQGNGLYGSWRITQISGGYFEIYSGYSILRSSERHGLHIRMEPVPYRGTLIVAQINYGEKIDLTDALTFRGKKHSPIDFIEVKYESDDKGNALFSLANESEGFGSRSAGLPVRQKLLNISRMLTSGKIIVDCSNIPLVSSSYADEVFGKLFAEVGPINFGKVFELVKVDDLTKGLIEKAIYQRMKVT